MLYYFVIIQFLFLYRKRENHFFYEERKLPIPSFRRSANLEVKDKMGHLISLSENLGTVFGFIGGWMLGTVIWIWFALLYNEGCLSEAWKEFRGIAAAMTCGTILYQVVFIWIGMEGQVEAKGYMFMYVGIGATGVYISFVWNWMEYARQATMPLPNFIDLPGRLLIATLIVSGIHAFINPLPSLPLGVEHLCPEGKELFTHKFMDGETVTAMCSTPEAVASQQYTFARKAYRLQAYGAETTYDIVSGLKIYETMFDEVTGEQVGEEVTFTY